MPSSEREVSSSFSAKRINSTTCVIQEDDVFREHPLIYVKIHPKVPIIILSDTGCDEPSEGKKHARFTQLRDYIENCPVTCNNDKPMNPHGERQYYIISTHCHYDHLGGITQFLAGGTTEIIASAAGRDFIESDLESHGLFNHVRKPAPYFQVTYWAPAFARLTHPLKHANEENLTTAKPVDLGVTIIHTPGHTPDELAWYDHDEMHLYIGDSFYEAGEEEMPIEWPVDGNMIEWVFSMRKLISLVESENSRAAKGEAEDEDGWMQVARRVRLGAGHQTYAADAMDLMERLWDVWWRTVKGEVPVSRKRVLWGQEVLTWRENDLKSGIYFEGPASLMEDTRRFFEGGGPSRGRMTD
ncbi:uncharacterized protein RCC_07992 [Ramularia collo-cygni]|uniref:Metallo-beta-lactamase domain-containing protein n=1 Tax=Ramularia collo-cygni TaxID=112498 RepID=A0A2D3VLK7_9PEZI|nr:uncharacterized protein RCC_07992 [Ramularia collo-cygni]CZT22123.1 uncharacterized protein RCC_07992 [Ramularia collo-cygni]